MTTASDSQETEMLAWSTETVVETPPTRHSWGQAIAGAAAMIGLSAAAAIAITVSLQHHKPSHATPAVAAAPASTTSTTTTTAPFTSETEPAAHLTTPPAPVAAPPMVVHPDPTTVVIQPPAANAADTMYLGLLERSGITITDRGQSIRSGHKICTLLLAGHSGEELTDAIMTENPTFDLPSAKGLVGSATIAYCPGALK